MFDLGSYWPASDNFAGGYTESLACSQFLVLFYSVLHHLFCIKTCYSVLMDVTQKWLTAWLFENVLESDGKMNLRYDTFILTADYSDYLYRCCDQLKSGVCYDYFWSITCYLALAKDHVSNSKLFFKAFSRPSVHY